MTAADPQRCNQCRFWRRSPVDNELNDPDWGFGLCRKRPPVLVDAMVSALMPRPSYLDQQDPDLDTVSLTTCSMWPATHSSDWCGAFETGEAA